MISIDTNILLPAVEETNPYHEKAALFLESIGDRDDVAISEFALLELYVLLRNPAVLEKPLSAANALEVTEAFRNHPHWQIVGFPPDSKAFHVEFWPRLGSKNFARRRAYDWRMALSLIALGVDKFATVNIKDFEGLGFQKVWNPLAIGTLDI
jgi:predicted nucleic acid-binding protein